MTIEVDVSSRFQRRNSHTTTTTGRRVQERPGKISFDDRGNAVYEWQNKKLTVEGEDGDRLRQSALDHPGLAIVDESPRGATPAIAPNPKGLRLGYNPYESGMLQKQQWKKKRDLREFSKWVQIKKKAVPQD